MGFQKFVLILYSQLQHVGGKNFVAQRKVLKFEDIINMTFQSNNVLILGYLLLIYNVI